MAHLRKKLSIAPRLLLYKLRGGSARDYGGQWDRFWTGVGKTGEGGDVLWDTEDLLEMQRSFDAFAPRMDLSLPFLDLGCGNGRRSKFLAERAAKVVGIDVSGSAIELARRECEGLDNLDFRVANAIDPATAQALHDELGDMNIYMRGVYHVIQPADRGVFSANLATLLGARGTIYQIETDGAFIDYMLQRPDTTPTGLPRLVHDVISMGIIPAGFGRRDELRWFPPASWEVIDSGNTIIRTVTLTDGQIGEVPAYYVLARTRAERPIPS